MLKKSVPGKSATRERQSNFSSPKRWEGLGRALAVGFLIVGALLLFLGHSHP